MPAEEKKLSTENRGLVSVDSHIVDYPKFSQSVGNSWNASHHILWVTFAAVLNDSIFALNIT